MTHHTLSITAKQVGLPASVVVDGHDISRAVRGIDLRLMAGEVPDVELKLLVLDVERLELEDAEVHVPVDTHDALIKLGWTPPKEDQPHA